MGAVVKLKHTFMIGDKWRWIPPRWARKLGAKAETLGPKLTGEVIDRSRARTAEWEAARKAPANTQLPGSVADVIQQYEASDWYESLGDATKAEIDTALKVIREAPIVRHQVTTVRKGHIQEFHKSLAAKYGRNKANKTVKWLKRTLTYAVDILELRETNPAFQMSMKHNAPRRQRWTVGEIDAFMAAAMEADRASIALSVRIGYDTAQRLGDVLSATWKQYDGEGITFIQAKTGEEVWTPLTKETRDALPKKRGGVQIIISETTKRPYHQVNFNRHFRAILEEAGIERDIQFRDLRRTAASEVLSGGGRAEPLTGHRPGSSALRVYEVPDKDAARAAQKARNRDKA